MKIIYPSGKREEWMDRNSALAFLNCDVGSAPHAQTLRATTGVAAGKRARVTSGFIEAIRTAAATAVGNARIYLIYNDGVTAFLLWVAMVTLNTVGSRQTIVIPEGLTLAGGSSITLYTDDDGTGGSLYYQGFVGLLTYDQ